MAKSQKITIFGGAGCKGATSEVFALSRKLKAPVIWSYRAKDILDSNNPYPVRMAGILGTSAGSYAMNQCDTLLLLGCGFAFNTMYPENAKIIQIDINGENLGRRHNISMGFVGDIKDTLTLLLPLLKERSDDSFAKECTQRYIKAQNHLKNIALQDIDSKASIYPENLCVTLNKLMAKDALVCADIGTPWAFSGRYIDSQGARRFFNSSLHGTMAAAIPFAMGLSLCEPDKQIVALCGDGGLAMLMGICSPLNSTDSNP